MDLEELTPEQKARFRACKTPEDVLRLAQEEGYELTEDQLEAVSGGDWSCGAWCPHYGGYSPKCS